MTFCLTLKEQEIIASGISYLYGYYTPENNLFYVGKGQKERLFGHINNSLQNIFDSHNTIKAGILRAILKDGKFPIIRILMTGSAKYCLKAEKLMIKKLGRICNKTGTLANISSGGEGGPEIGLLGAKKVAQLYPKSHFRKILIRARKALIEKYGEDAHVKMGQKAMRTLRKKHGEEGFKEELKRRSDLGNNEVSNKKKDITRIKNYGSLEGYYKATQEKRLATMKKRGGWSIKCFDLDTHEIKIVKKSEFDLSPNLVGMTSNKFKNLKHIN